jgi:hypothetical protein
MLEHARAHHPFDLGGALKPQDSLPAGLSRPILAVPIGDQLRCLAVALYGPHTTGNDFSHDERIMLAELAEKAASAFMKLTDDQLRRRIAILEGKLSRANSAMRAHKNGHGHPDVALRHSGKPLMMRR